MKKLTTIYLDFAAATPLWDEVRVALNLAHRNFGNTGSLHSVGKSAADALASAKEEIAHLMACRVQELVITSGATESNNLAILGVAKEFLKTHPLKPSLIISSIEHPSVLEPARFLAPEVDLNYLNVDQKGVVKLDQLETLLQRDVPTLVSIMGANNEIGSIQPITRIAKLIKNYRSRRKYPILLHSDAAQLAAWRQIQVNNLGVDLLTISAAKIGGGHGAGLLYVKRGVVIQPQIYGGGQQNNLRSGTPNLAATLALASALKKTWSLLPQNTARIKQLKELLATGIIGKTTISFRNDHAEGLPNILSLTFKGISAEDLVYAADAVGIGIAAGSACSTEKNDKISHILEAIGLNRQQALSTARFSLGWHTTKAEINRVVKLISEIVSQKLKDQKMLDTIIIHGQKLAKDYAQKHQ